MYFVKPLFFEFEPIKIANVSENGNFANDLARFIALYEKQCLQEILGACLYKELIESLFDFNVLINIDVFSKRRLAHQCRELFY